MLCEVPTDKMYHLLQVVVHVVKAMQGVGQAINATRVYLQRRYASSKAMQVPTQ
jgi:hypothetical protein